METPVLVEQLSDHRYRATGTGRFAVSVEGATEAQAVANFEAMARRMVASAKWASVTVPDGAAGNGQRTSAPPDGNAVHLQDKVHPDPLPVPNNQKILASIGWAADIPKDDWQQYLQHIQDAREEENARVTGDE